MRYKTILICIVFFFSIHVNAQQSNETSPDSSIAAIVKVLESDNPPLLILKLGRAYVQIDKNDLIEMGANKIQKIEVFERAIQLKSHYAKNGAYLVYPKKKYKKELKKKYLKTKTIS